MSGQYVTALYLRISDEDNNSGEARESESISGQRLLLTDFVRGHRELSGSRIIELVDDGFSGTNFDRPGIKKLLEMAKSHQVNCIVVKDFSRFGRNYLEAGNYLEQIFPFLGIRFLSVNDHFDSFENIGAAGAIEVGFKNIIHEAYSKDLSEKIRSVRRMMAEQGKFVTAFAPYGYKKAEKSKNQLLVDEECAVVVRRIFELFLSGMGSTSIACLLNNEGIPSPYMVRRQRKEKFHCTGCKKETHWTAGTVTRILSDQRYVGDAVYGKVAPKETGSKKDVRIPEENWIIVPDAHPGIVIREIFEAARSLKKKYRVHESRNRADCIAGHLQDSQLETAILTCLQLLVLLVQKGDKAAKQSDAFKLYRRFKAGKISEDIYVKKTADMETELLHIRFPHLHEEAMKEFLLAFHVETDGKVIIVWSFRDPYQL